MFGINFEKQARHDIFDVPVEYDLVKHELSAAGRGQTDIGTINLIRAVYDEAENVVDRIDAELADLETKKHRLFVEREAHLALYKVASGFAERLNITVQKTEI